MEIDTLSRKTTRSKLFLLPFEKGSTLKGKNLFPEGNLVGFGPHKSK